jgi:hypothetical protein
MLESEQEGFLFLHPLLVSFDLLANQWLSALALISYSYKWVQSLISAFPYTSTSTGTWSYYAHTYISFNLCKMNGSWNFVIIMCTIWLLKYKLKLFHAYWNYY